MTPNRIIFDLQPTETRSSRLRGVGNYTHALFQHIYQQHEGQTLGIARHPYLSSVYDWSGIDRKCLLHIPEVEPVSSRRDFRGGFQDTELSRQLARDIRPLQPDIYHISNLFEGLEAPIGLPTRHQLPPQTLVTATVYDLIPWLFPDVYLPEPGLRKWYLHRMGLLRQVDLLFTISESTRQDLIQHLPVAPDRVKTIYGGVDPRMQPVDMAESGWSAFRQKYGLTGPFLLYTGGDDYRKNMSGLLRGYQALPPEIQQTHQLVVVCALSDSSRKRYEEQVRQAGLRSDRVQFTGFVPFADLRKFYSSCALMVFPSLYEGLGLPVLEAIACGRPAAVGDHSSLREIIRQPEARFPADDPQEMARCWARLLGDQDGLTALHAAQQPALDTFNWNRTGERALRYWQDAYAEKANTRRTYLQAGGPAPRKLAYLSPLPPQPSGIAAYSALLLPHLMRYARIDLFVQSERVESDWLNANFPIYPAHIFPEVAREYDVVIYEMGNSEYHSHLLDWLPRFPGIVVLHDFFLSGLLHVKGMDEESDILHQQMIYSHGPQALRWLLSGAETLQRPAIWELIDRLPACRTIFDHARCIISFSGYSKSLAEQFFPEGWAGKFRVVPQPALPPSRPALSRADAKEALGLPADAVLVCSFGFQAEPKQSDLIVAAFLQLAEQDQDQNLHLALVGKLEPNEYGHNLLRMVQRSPFSGRIHLTGYLDKAQYGRYLSAADLAVQLRTQSRGETSKAVLDALSHGVPVLVNDYAGFREYPDHVVYKIPEVATRQTVQAGMAHLLSDPTSRARYGLQGVQWVQDRHHPEQVAARLAEIMEEVDHRAVNTAWHKSAFAKRQLLIDVSFLVDTDYTAGIPRVVWKTVDRLLRRDDPHFRVYPVVFTAENRLALPGTDWLDAQGWTATWLAYQLDQPGADLSEQVNAGDILVMLDSSWGRYEALEPVLQDWRTRGLYLVFSVYDLLPVQLGGTLLPAGAVEPFTRYFRQILIKSDGVFCISRTVAEQLRQFAQAQELSDPAPIDYWYLGNDFQSRAKKTSKRQAAIPGPYFLCVGSITPRKSQRLLLRAFLQLWYRGATSANLVFVGRPGYRSEDFEELLAHSDYHNVKAFYPGAVTDEELHELYRDCAGVILLSRGEGFGLPVLEALAYGQPVICTDLPVFRELLGDDYPFFIPVELVADEQMAFLVKALNEQIEAVKGTWSDQKERYPRVGSLTWAESGAMLVEKMRQLIGLD